MAIKRGGKSRGALKSGGRKKGTPNKATAQVKELAQKYAEAAIAELARLATKAESEAARVSAIKELLDRAFGKAPQAITGDANQPVQHQHSGRVGVGWMTLEQAIERGWARA